MATKKTFDYKLGDRVDLTESDESGGLIIGRAQYTNSNPAYLVRYVAGDGRQVENWISEDALQAA